jgi:hypothetical protein
MILKNRKEVEGMFNLKWRNKFSGEEGYVASVKKTKGHFVNTFDQADAKRYQFEKSVKNDIALLVEMGEGENNDFEIVPALS